MSLKTSCMAVGLMLSLLFFSQGCRSKSPVASQQPAILSSSGQITESDLGVPIYPNSTPNNNQSFAFQGNSKSAHSVRTVSASLVTADSVEQVKKFYREKLGGNVQIQEHQSGSGKLVDLFLQNSKEQVRIEVAPQASGQGAIIVILTQARS